MDAYENRIARAFRENANDKIAELSASLSTTIAPDYPTYRQKVGEIKGIQIALNILKQIEDDLRSEEAPAKPVGRKTNAVNAYEA